MVSIHCTLVGFRHHAWRGATLAKRLASAAGQSVVLMRDSENHRNCEATVACIDTEVVAYVANDDCHRIAAYLDETEFGLLYGHIVEVNTADCRCTAEIEVEKTMEVRPVLANEAFDAWDSRWQHLPVARPDDRELRQRMLQRHLACLLSQHPMASESLCCDLEHYMCITTYDISAEASNNRRDITNLLRHSADARLRQYGERMEVIITQMGDNEVCREVAHRLATVFATGAPVADMVRHGERIGRATLEEALRDFPHGLHDEYRLSVADFISRAYYLHIPRRALRRFVSAQLLLDALSAAPTRGGLSADIRHAVLDYVARIDACTTEPWAKRTKRLWNTLMDTFAERLTKLNGAKDTLFNARFVCMVIGRLIDQGVYDNHITQADYGRRLALGGRNMRSSVNRGLVDDDATRQKVDDIVASL